MPPRRLETSTVWIGTSGWQYRHWRSGFYSGVPGRRWLDWYVEHFATVELNASFYRLPPRSRFEAWAGHLPDGFLMGVKMSRYVTHIRRLADPAGPIERFVDAVGGLGDHLGPVLVQLPPDLPADPERLDATLACFPPAMRVAVEPRHATWWTDAVRDVLVRHGAALVEADRKGPITPAWVTAPWRYLRFHVGRGRPAPCYRTAELEAWADRLQPGCEVFAYFNNDPGGCAVRDARLFAEACSARDLVPTRVPPPALTPLGTP